MPGKEKEGKVCSPCNNLLKNPQQISRAYAPPEALQKRLDTLEKPGGPPIIVYRDNPKMTSLRRGLSQDDQKIVDRLESLQRERKKLNETPSESQIRDRLTKLKGAPSLPEREQGSGSGTEFYKPPDTRSDVDKTRSLLEGIQKEVELDGQHPTPEQDIAIRLAKLRGQDPDEVRAGFTRSNLPDPSAFLMQNNQVENLEDLDLDEVGKLLDIVGKDVELEARNAVKELEKDKAIQEQLAKLRVRPANRDKEDQDGEEDKDSDEDENEQDRITKQILAEQELEERLGGIPGIPGYASDTSRAKPGRPPYNLGAAEEDVEPEELPWCVICNEDATLRCDGDLYCRSCYKEFYAGEDPREHTVTQFKPK